MPNVCSICRHDDREEIDQALLGGTPYRTIAERKGVSLGALNRHKAHVSARLVNATTVAQESAPQSFRERLDGVKCAAWTVLQNSLKDEKRFGMALQAMARIEKQLQLEAELKAKLNDSIKQDLGLQDSSKEPKSDMSRLTPDELRTVIALIEKAQGKVPNAAQHAESVPCDSAPYEQTLQGASAS
jgi:hypothetical protein